MKRTMTAADAAERRLLGSSLLALAALAVGLVLTAPAHAASEEISGAEKLRRLDIMLMVTALRCRASDDNFIADYGAFTASHLRELNTAGAQLRADFEQRFGLGGAQAALDRLSTAMANGYGQGHPWLSCRDLKTATRNLALAQGMGTLEEAADQLLGTGPTRLASAR